MRTGSTKRRSFIVVHTTTIVFLCSWCCCCCLSETTKTKSAGGDPHRELVPKDEDILVPATDERLEGDDSMITSQTKVLTPLYVYPDTNRGETSVYRRVAASKIPQIVILNPNNGREARRRPNAAWRKATDVLRGEGSSVEKILGYVHVRWLREGGRTLTDIKNNVDQYAKNGWGVDGIFFDESPASTEKIAELRELAEHVKVALGHDALVVLNPGTHVPDAFFQFADVVVVFEDFHTQWGSFDLKRYAANVRNNPARPFAVIVRDVPDDALSETYETAIRRGAGYVFLGREGAQFHKPGCFFFEAMQVPSACPP